MTSSTPREDTNAESCGQVPEDLAPLVERAEQWLAERAARRRTHSAETHVFLEEKIIRDLLSALDAAEGRVGDFRELLWLRHGCGYAALYGDDGEMQCGKCGIDFKRESYEDIARRFEQIAAQALSAQHPKAGAQEAEGESGGGA